jgi:hypothetical protein
MWETEELGEKPVPVSLRPPQLPHGLTRARTRASAVRGRWQPPEPWQANSTDNTWHIKVNRSRGISLNIFVHHTSKIVLNKNYSPQRAPRHTLVCVEELHVIIVDYTNQN